MQNISNVVVTDIKHSYFCQLPNTVYPNWHSTGVHEDWPVANVSLLRQIYEWAAGVGDHAVIAVYVFSFCFLLGQTY